MKCPQCGGLKQLTPESKRTETCVWRRRICKTCHHNWLTKESISAATQMPSDVWRFTDTVMRHAPKKKPDPKTAAPIFDTRALTDIQW